jgi:hypothetical protein
MWYWRTSHCGNSYSPPHAPRTARDWRHAIASSGSCWLACGRTGARHWCSSSRTRSCGGTAPGFVAAGFGGHPDQAGRPSILVPPPWSRRWRQRIHYGAHRGFTASCACSASTYRSAASRACCNTSHVDVRKRGRRFSRITSHPRRRWILHCPDSDGSNSLRPRRPVACSPAYRTHQRH